MSAMRQVGATMGWLWVCAGIAAAAAVLAALFLPRRNQEVTAAATGAGGPDPATAGTPQAAGAE